MRKQFKFSVSEFLCWSCILLVTARCHDSQPSATLQIGYPASSTSVLAQTCGTLDSSATASKLFEGGVADSAGKFGFVVSQNSGIDAIDLHSGTELWNSSAVNFPLLTVGHCLVAESSTSIENNMLTLLFLDTAANGNVLITTQPYRLPTWADVSSGIGHSTKISAVINENKILLSWETHQSSSGGASLGGNLPVSPSQDAFGLAQLDIESEVWTTLVSQATPLSPTLGLPASLSNLVSASYSIGSATSILPIVTSGTVNSFTLLSSGQTQSLQLSTWDLASGAAINSIALTSGAGLSLRLGEDGNSVVVSNLADLNGYSSAIYALPSGIFLGAISNVSNVEDVSVVGNIIYQVTDNGPEEGSGYSVRTPRNFQAQALGAINISWQIPILPLTTYLNP